MHPQSRHEFEAVMEAVDGALSSKGVPFWVRPVLAMGELSKRVQGVVQIPSGAQAPTEGVFLGRDLAAHAIAWYERRYGRRLQMRPDFGRVIVALRGSVWQIRIPMVFGRIGFYLHPTLVAEKNSSGRPVCNVLTLVDDLPVDLRSSLSIEEQSAIWETFRLAYNAYYEMQAVDRRGLVRSAFADHDSAAFHLLDQRGDLGQSKWSALQAAEKMIKEVILRRGCKPPRHHRLAPLVDKAGISAVISAQLLARVQCDAGIRYEGPRPSLTEAIDAHHASLEISSMCAGVVSGKLREDQPGLRWRRPLED